MKASKIILTTVISLLTAATVSAQSDNKPWGWATCADEAGTAYNLNGGGVYGYDNATKTTITALGSGAADDAQIKAAIAKFDIIYLDGSNGDFTISSKMKLVSVKNKTIVGINNARLCTQFYLTDADIAYLKQQNLDGLSSTDQYTGTLPDGNTLTCDKRAFFTKKAMEELSFQKTGTFTLPNGAGIIELDGSDENIIIRNINFIGPGAVDIDGSDLITNLEAKHVWIDHCNFVDGQDGCLDSKRCDYATYSWCKFSYTSRTYSHPYTNGCGWADGSMILHLTFGYCEWGAGCGRRLPQCGDCYVHLVNNFHNCPGNSAGMTINDNCTALVEGCCAASGVALPLTGSGSDRKVYAHDNSFNYTSTSTSVTVPYKYTTIPCNNVPAILEASNGVGVTLSNDNVLPEIVANEKPAVDTQCYYFDSGFLTADNILTYGDGATLEFPYTSGKAYANGVKITTPDGASTAIKISNGKTNTFTAPTGKYATQATIYCYFNAKDENQNYEKYPDTGFRVTFWKSFAGVSYDETTATIIRTRDASDPAVISYDLGGVSQFSFTNTGEQVCFVLYVTYGEPSAITTVANDTNKTLTSSYNIAGQRVNSAHKGIIISNGRKYIVK